MANPIIYERHNGATLHRWKTGNQYSFVAKMYYEDGLSINDICDVLNENRGTILKPLKAYNLFFEGKDILEREEGVSIDVGSFNFTNLERFINYDDARKILGLEFDNEDGQLMISLPREEFERRVFYIFKILIDAERFSRDFDTETHRAQFVDNLRKQPEFQYDATVPAMSIENMRKAERFARNGGTVVFSTRLPRQSTRVGDDPELRELVARMFPGGETELIEGRKYGKGRVCFLGDVTPRKVDSVLRRHEEKYSLRFIEGDRIRNTHKIVDGKNVWFFANPGDADKHAVVELTGRFTLSAWDPHTGNITAIPATHNRNGTTSVELSMPARRSLFLVEE